MSVTPVVSVEQDPPACTGVPDDTTIEIAAKTQISRRHALQLDVRWITLDIHLGDTGVRNTEAP